ncbi:SpoIIE family protein phosphatase [Streptomyces avicenniae]|uniref:SpoIIE family protein phosphatase n=1 Tax=Streptomyces avicenniae TaxID=500153 RepID=UPI00069C1698|nr:SpoIIE family protein phosphatase [Streptomyces avicenniae]
MGHSSGVESLDRFLIDAVRSTGGHSGVIYLLAPGEPVLRLTSLLGLPAAQAVSWARISLDAPMLLTEAVRERRLRWDNSQENQQPGLSPSMPYPFAIAQMPLLSADGVCWGSLGVVWPPSHPAELSETERETLKKAADGMAALLRRAADSGTPITAAPQPREVWAPRTHTPGPDEALAAADFAERLPEGCCSLRLDGSVVYANSAAAQLLGADGPDDLLGAPLWDRLPWLNDPVHTDRYRAALISREPKTFLALRPPDQPLRFRLYPGARGISVRITPSDERATAPVRGDTPTQDSVLQRVTQLASALTQAVGVQDVVRLVADQVLPAFDAQGLVLYVTEGGRLRVAGYRGYTTQAIEHFDGTPLESPPNAAAQVVHDRRPQFMDSADEMLERYPEVPDLTGKSAWAFLPLVSTGHAVGCFVLSYVDPHTFTRDERTVLTSLAGLIAQALDRARLFDAKQQLARQLQSGLLPHELPALPGLDVAVRYLPATRGMDIGGDFYDVIPLDSGDVAVVIGDVQGHNVTAAALMGQVRTAVHASAGEPPQEVLGRTNRLLTDLDPGLFTSCLYIQLDVTRCRAVVATAGHPPPLLRHPDGRITVPDVPPGPLLGIDESAAYPAVELPLSPGSVLLLYTDGLVERPGLDPDVATGQLARDLADAVEHSLDLGGTMDDLADHLLRTRHTENRDDDIALLLLSPQEPDAAQEAAARRS